MAETKETKTEKKTEEAKEEKTTPVAKPEAKVKTETSDVKKTVKTEKVETSTKAVESEKKPTKEVETKEEKIAVREFTSKLFHKYDFSEVRVNDASLQNYISLESLVIPHTHGRYTGDKQFWKAKLNIVERLINKMMRSGQGKRKLKGKYIRGRNGCGKKLKIISIVDGAFDIIYAKTKTNPIQVYVDAIENAGPKEDITVVRFGGVSRQQSVDVSPLRRIDESIKNIALAGFSESFKSKMSASEALANEIIKVAKNDPQSFSISRKNAPERMAQSAR